MKLQDQVCALEQAKVLKSLGVKQDSLFYWYTAPHDNGCDKYWETNEIAYSPWFVNASTLEDESNGCTYYVDGTDQYSAFTVAELCVMLPDYYPSWRFKVNEASEARRWITTVICGPKPPGIDNIHTAHEFDRYGSTQAISLATLLIALLETEAIKVDEVNARLCA